MTERDPATTIEEPQGTPLSWHSKVAAILFVIFCFEVGVFLLVFPWMDSWNSNWLRDTAPLLRRWWDNPFLRGALSGVGLVNIYISFVEMFRLLRAL